MVFRIGENIWRLERAHRAAVLIDGAAFFLAVREAMLAAHHTIFVVGWDLHSRTRLVGPSGEAKDGFPDTFSDFVSALVERRPDLTVHLLAWDYSVVYAAERELFPTIAFGWSTPPQVRFRLDEDVPFGSSQHQKIIVIDDAVAFSGGLDVTIRRWDTSEHLPDTHHRVDPAGKPYAPFHDVQIVVDGPAARALAEIVRGRWVATGEDASPPADTDSDAWPASVAADLTDVDVGIARTVPGLREQPEVREVERLFGDSLEIAEHAIYIENQFLTCARFAERLARRMQAKPDLETLIIAPHAHESWLEARSMRNGRIRFMHVLRDAGVADRVRLVSPQVQDGEAAAITMVHSKVMIIDDRFLRIGSANLNNRSMGTDTECDLAVSAKNDVERAAIRNIRNRLIGDHCGVAAEQVAAALAEDDSLLRLSETLSGHGHHLRPIDDGEPDESELSTYIEHLADPERPIALDALIQNIDSEQREQATRRLKLSIAGVALLVLGLAFAWQATPLAALVDPATLQKAASGFAQSAWAPAIVVGLFVLGGLVAFPVLILIIATAATFGMWPGLLYAAIGALTSAVVTYSLGALIGEAPLRELIGERLDRVRNSIVRRGVLAVAIVRLVPVAPFTVVNLVAGASRIRFADFVAGTVLGMAPGLIIISALGQQAFRMLTDPTSKELAILAALVLGLVGLAVAVQGLVSRVRSARSS